LHLQRLHSGEMVEVKGRLTATLVQNCVITLEPFETSVAEDFTAYFVRLDTLPKPEEVQIEDDQSPESIDANGNIDLGELTAQHLALAIDPHPRKPGAHFEIPAEVAATPAHPFAVLAEFREKKKAEKEKNYALC
jgi:uncharacterized metal-binding protein YceD (DUF177 family)